MQTKSVYAAMFYSNCQVQAELHWNTNSYVQQEFDKTKSQHIVPNAQWVLIAKNLMDFE